PVLGCPAGGVGGINDDDRQARVGGHLGEPVPQASGRDARDYPAEGPAAPATGGAAARPFPSFGAGLGEVQVFDDDGAGAVVYGGGDKARDRGSQVPVAGGGRQPRQAEGDRGRGAQDVAVRGEDGGVEVAVIDVDGHHRVPPQVIQRCCGGGLGL